MNDGTEKNISAKWSNIDTSEYASKGTFSVKGTVLGSDAVTIADVTVSDTAFINAIVCIAPNSVSTAIEIAPELPNRVTEF